MSVDVAVGQMRAIEFVADNPGDWAFHCHKSHHTMNAMGHEVPNLIGVDHRGVAKKINDLIPGYMVMGDKGGSMGDMQMPLPENTLPMMTGRGPFGNLEMGGMFTTLKIREGLAREWTGEVPAAPQAPGAARDGGHGGHGLTVRKPVTHKH